MKTYNAKKTSSRREFLKAISTTSAVVAGSTLSASAIAKAIEHKPRYGMLIDTRRCVGCHACSISCRAENNVPENHHRSWVEYTEKGTFPDATLHFLPRLCNQCSTPQCTSVCPTNATYIRDDGIVVIDPEICIGCKYCIQACPYDARFINPETGSADKCDFCVDRLAVGMEPACVASCFNRARIFGDLNDSNSEISRLIAKNAVTVLRPEMGTNPNVFYIGIDYADEHDVRFPNQHIRVTTHRDDNKRR